MANSPQIEWINVKSVSSCSEAPPHVHMHFPSHTHTCTAYGTSTKRLTITRFTMRGKKLIPVTLEITVTLMGFSVLQAQHLPFCAGNTFLLYQLFVKKWNAVLGMLHYQPINQIYLIPLSQGGSSNVRAAFIMKNPS